MVPETLQPSIGNRIAAFFKKRNVQLALILIAWIWTIAAIAAKETQWDFKVYYYATVAHAHGENPYDLGILNKYSPDKIIFPFIYPVLTCYVFRPLTLLPYGVAYQVWLLLKVCLAIYLLWLWRKRFLQWGALPFMILIASATYLGAFYRDLNSGNVTLIEQAFLWSGFFWLLEGKPFRFVLAVAAAAFFKFSLAVFLVTVLFTKLKHRTAALALGCALILGYVGILWATDAQSFDHFWQAGSNLKEYTADFNHSTLAVFHDLGKLFCGAGIDSDGGRSIVIALYVAFALLISVVTIQSIRKFKHLEPRDTLFMTICALCFLYALAMPRMKNYTLILLAVPTYLVLTSGPSKKTVVILTILLILPRIKIAPPSSVFGFYQYIHPWLMAVIIWSMFISYTRRGLSHLPWRN